MNRRKWIALGSIVGIHILWWPVAFLVAGRNHDPRNELPMAILSGWYAGQVTFLATLTALTSRLREMPRRLIIAVVLLLFNWLVLLAAHRMAGSPPRPPLATSSALAGSIGFFISTGVLLLICRVSRWRLVPAETNAENGRHIQFHLRHVLGATAIVAVALGLGRQAWPEMRWYFYYDAHSWLLFSVWCIPNALLVPPACLWLAFRHDSVMAALLLVLCSPFYAVATACVSIVTVGSFADPGSSFRGDKWIATYVAEAVCLFITVVGLRHVGWQPIRAPKVAPTNDKSFIRRTRPDLSGVRVACAAIAKYSDAWHLFFSQRIELCVQYSLG